MKNTRDVGAEFGREAPAFFFGPTAELIVHPDDYAAIIADTKEAHVWVAALLHKERVESLTLYTDKANVIPKGSYFRVKR